MQRSIPAVAARPDIGEDARRWTGDMDTQKKRTTPNTLMSSGRRSRQGVQAQRTRRAGFRPSPLTPVKASVKPPSASALSGATAGGPAAPEAVIIQAQSQLSCVENLVERIAHGAASQENERYILELSEIIERDPSCQSKIAEAGGVKFVLESMEVKNATGTIQREGVRTMELICRGNAKATTSFISFGGVQTIAKAMASNLAKEDVQEAGCRVFRNAAACNAQCQAEVGKHGGILAILDAMKAFGQTPAIQEAGCRALRELAAYSNANQDEIYSKGGIPTVLKAMEAHLSSAPVQEIACGVLRNLAACNAEHQVSAVSRGAVPLVTKAMRTHADTPSLLAAGCWALFCLAVHNTEMHEEVAAYGAIGSVLHAMEAHPMEARIQEAGCWFLKELAQQVAGTDRATLARSVQTVLKSMGKHPGVKSVQTAVGSALRRLAEHDASGWVRTTCLGRCRHLGGAATRRALSAIEE
eukprot:TRINITY_DN56403_c0_g1_i1.p1 TRINITY_DN56403_c0_g1~~TRINITY_DN56403_c0_g1_i1.p1  ORF type:complete len:471 (-),score=66.16 TRINITY_DN56403_c0_g1_i1:104-1516(-)